MRKRKTPQRKCIVTNEMKPKKELIRVVRNKDGEVFVDPTGKKNGRGAYVSLDINVIDKAKQSNVFANAFQTKIDDTIYDELKTYVQGKNK
ncbi:RNase P modulator RnpM [Virgibacillus sp. W0430]|uniref:RNase P modulator RnpM n=1 Tax=Virgibacillus sp. W0430 TaxID=3391580 RepID=UPI003F445D50